MAVPVLSLVEIGLRYGPDPLFRELTTHVQQGERLALVGRNGAGKSTLLKVVAGLVEPDEGTITIAKGVQSAYLPQEPDLDGFACVRDYILAGLASEQADETYRAEPLMDALGVAGDASPGQLSGGEQRRAALARTLICEPDILLLDEPTNHLDVDTILWLEGWLKSFRGTLILISHDRAFMRAVTNGVLWLDRGQVQRYEGAFDGFDAWQEAFFEAENQRLHKLDKFITSEARWAVEGISARRKRNQGRVRRLAELRAERRNHIAATGRVQMSLKEGSASGTCVIEAKSVSKAYGARTLFQDFSTRILRGDRIGFIGKNGAGKTTLLRMLTGDIQPDSGSVRLGTGLVPLFIDQKRLALDENKTLSDILTGGSGEYVHRADGEAVHVRTYLKEFLFDPGQADTPVSALSGGERGRLLLAAGFARPSNLVILDEPTNDLDMDTLDLLVDVLAGYSGTLLLVSHDRDFLDRIVTSTIAIEAGAATEYAGGYSDYLRQRDAIGNDAKARKEKRDNVTSFAAAKQRVQVKLSYKDQRELDALPAEIEALSGEIQLTHAKLAEADFYTRDPAGFNTLSRKLADMEHRLEDMENRWLELEELKENLASGR